MVDGGKLLNSFVSDLSGSFLRHRTDFLLRAPGDMTSGDEKTNLLFKKLSLYSSEERSPLTLIVSYQCSLHFSPFTQCVPFSALQLLLKSISPFFACIVVLSQVSV